MEDINYELVPQELIKELFPNNDEKGSESVHFIKKCVKFNRYGMKQGRILVLSTHGLYLVNGKRLSQKVMFEETTAVVKAMQSKEFVMQFSNSNDIRMVHEDREDILDWLKSRAINLNPAQSIKVFGIPKDSVKQFQSYDKKYINEPEEKYLLKDESIYSEEDNAKQKEIEVKVQNIDSKNFDFESMDKTFAVKNNMKMMIKDVSDNMASLFNNNLLKVQKPEEGDKEDMRGSSCMKRRTTLDVKFDKVELSDFKILMVIGRGAFGKVFLGELKLDGKFYAIKSIRKDVLIESDQVDNTLLEKDIMFECDHNFLVNMDYMFQNELRLYFVMPFIRGGELYKIYQAQKRFNEETVKFYAAQMILAIDYLHNKGIVHRDLKLENILVDSEGFIKIIDYGLAKMLKDDEESQSFCGTPEYLAPEMVLQQGHDKNVDWWATGVLMYEMLIGVSPFYNRNKNTLLKKIKQQKVVFPDRNKYKIEFSDEFVSLVEGLLDKDKSTRLGSKGGATEILAHPFFASIDAAKLAEKDFKPPFIPEIEGKFGEEDFLKYFNSESGEAIDDTHIPKQNQQYIKANQNLFDGFDQKKKK